MLRDVPAPLPAPSAALLPSMSANQVQCPAAGSARRMGVWRRRRVQARGCEGGGAGGGEGGAGGRGVAGLGPGGFCPKGVTGSRQRVPKKHTETGQIYTHLRIENRPHLSRSEPLKHLTITSCMDFQNKRGPGSFKSDLNDPDFQTRELSLKRLLTLFTLVQHSFSI